MSKADLDLAKRATLAVLAKPPDFETINEIFHPDHAWVPLASQLEGGEAKGARGFRHFLQRQEVAWEAEVEGSVDVGNGRVLSVHALQMRGDSSEIEFSQRLWILQTIRSGQIHRSEAFADPADAMRAALDAPAD